MSPRNLLRRFLSSQCRRSGPASVPTRAQVPRPPLPARRLRLCGRRPLGWLQVALRPADGAAACRWRPAAGCALRVPRALGAQVPGPATCERRPPGPQHAVRSHRADVHAGRVGGDRRRRPRSRADASGTRGGRWVRGWPSRSPSCCGLQPAHVRGVSHGEWHMQQHLGDKSGPVSRRLESTLPAGGAVGPAASDWEGQTVPQA